MPNVSDVNKKGKEKQLQIITILKEENNMQNDHIEEFNGHVNWTHKLTPYKLQYRCSDDCLIQGCPSHIAQFTINHAVDTFTIDWGNGEKINLDGVQMAMIKDFMYRFGELSTM